MRETWYILEDGSIVDPREVEFDEKGAPRHSSGPVAMRSPGVPSTKNIDPDEERAKQKPQQQPHHHRRDMAAEDPKRPYQTRAGRGE